MRRKTGLAAVLGLTFALVVGLAGRAVADTAEENDFVNRVNSLRASVGVAPLKVDPALTAVARRWAAKMAGAGQLSHNPNLHAELPAGWTSDGENVGYGPDVTYIESLFVSDPPHYANLVNPSFTLIGVGVVSSGGNLWAVQDFTGGRSASGATVPAPAPVPVVAGTAETAAPAADTPAHVAPLADSIEAGDDVLSTDADRVSAAAAALVDNGQDDGA